MSSGPVQTADRKTWFCRERIIAGPPMSMFSHAGVANRLPPATVGFERVEIDKTDRWPRIRVGPPWPRRGRRRAQRQKERRGWAGCRVLTRPSSSRVAGDLRDIGHPRPRRRSPRGCRGGKSARCSWPPGRGPCRSTPVLSNTRSGLGVRGRGPGAGGKAGADMASPRIERAPRRAA